MFAVFEVWCWTATACGLDKMDQGRRRLWVMSEKCQGVLYTSLYPIFSVLFWSLLLLNLQDSVSQKLHLCFVIPFMSVFFFSSCSLLFPTKDTHVKNVCLSSCPGFNNGESKSSLVERLGFPTVYRCTLNLCQN